MLQLHGVKKHTSSMPFMSNKCNPNNFNPFKMGANLGNMFEMSQQRHTHTKTKIKVHLFETLKESACNSDGTDVARVLVSAEDMICGRVHAR